MRVTLFAAVFETIHLRWRAQSDCAVDPPLAAFPLGSPEPRTVGRPGKVWGPFRPLSILSTIPIPKTAGERGRGRLNKQGKF